MAPSLQTTHISPRSEKPSKLKRLSHNARIQKRPILHPPVPSPYTNSSQTKVVYVSATTPFISAVKRVRKLLAQAEKRSLGAVGLIGGKGTDHQKIRTIAKRVKEPEEVTLKATNRAIEKALGLAIFFQGQEDCRVRVGTGSVNVVDDILEVEAEASEVGAVTSSKPEVCGGEKSQDVNTSRDVQAKHIKVATDGPNNSFEDKNEDVELPETQIRKMSFVDIRISLR